MQAARVFFSENVCSLEVTDRRADNGEVLGLRVSSIQGNPKSLNFQHASSAELRRTLSARAAR